MLSVGCTPRVIPYRPFQNILHTLPLKNMIYHEGHNTRDPDPMTVTCPKSRMYQGIHIFRLILRYFITTQMYHICIWLSISFSLRTTSRTSLCQNWSGACIYDIRNSRIHGQSYAAIRISDHYILQILIYLYGIPCHIRCIITDRFLSGIFSDTFSGKKISIGDFSSR